MKLLANENFPLSSVKILLSAGYDIKIIGIECPGILDSEVMEIAIKEHRLILTFDRDYGELIFKKGYKPVAGVIYIRWESFQPESPGYYMIELLKMREIQFTNMLTVIGEKTIRQRSFK